MRVFGRLAVIVCVGMTALVQTQGITDPTGVLLQAREALGGDKKLSSVKTLVVTGRTRKVQGNNLVPVEFEIAIEFPDKYVRKDEIPAQESGPTSLGFNGTQMIQLPLPTAPPPGAARGGTPPPAGASAAGRATGTPAAAPPATAGGGTTAPPPATSGAAPGGRPTAPPAGAAAGGAPPAGATPPAAGTTPPAAGATPPAAGTTPPAAGAAPGAAGPGRGPGPGGAMPPGGGRGGPPVSPIMNVKQDFAKLTLGLFAGSFPSYPLTFTLAGQAEAPQGKADVVDVKGEGNFAVKLFVNSQTHLPIMISWTTPPTPNLIVVALPGQPPPKDLAPGSIVVEAPALPGPTATKEEQDKYAKDVQALRGKALASAKPIENRIFYSDYKDAGNGLVFPFRLRRSFAGETVEETTFDQFKINPKIDPRKFEVAK
jgi:hypothetical protein